MSFEPTGRFPGVLYLEPTPAEPLLALTQRIGTHFPDFPPYGGAFDPTRTSRWPRGTTRSWTRQKGIAAHLPLHAHVREALLLVEVEPDHGRWEVGVHLPLGGR